MTKPNTVTKKEVMEAINYLHANGFVEEMTTDKKYYTEILLKSAGNFYGIDLGFKK